MPLGDYEDKYGYLTQDNLNTTSPLSSAVSGYTYSPSKGGNDYGPPSPFGNSGAGYQQPSAEMIASTPTSSSSPGFADWWSKMAPDKKKSLGTGLLSAGLNLMANAGRTSPTPISSMGLLGEAGLQGLGAYQQQEQLNKSDKRDVLQNALLGYQVAQQPLHQQILQGQASLIPAQLKNLEAEASMRKAKAEIVGIPTALDTAKTDYYKAKAKEGSGGKMTKTKALKGIADAYAAKARFNKTGKIDPVLASFMAEKGIPLISSEDTVSEEDKSSANAAFDAIIKNYHDILNEGNPVIATTPTKDVPQKAAASSSIGSEYSQEDIAHTAAKYGITPIEVIQRLNMRKNIGQ